MSGFIAGGDTSAAYPISNADFWPEIDGQQLRAAMRIDSSVTDDRLEVATVNAMIEATLLPGLVGSPLSLDVLRTMAASVPLPIWGWTSSSSTTSCTRTPAKRTIGALQAALSATN